MSDQTIPAINARVFRFAAGLRTMLRTVSQDCGVGAMASFCHKKEFDTAATSRFLAHSNFPGIKRKSTQSVIELTEDSKCLGSIV